MFSACCCSWLWVLNFESFVTPSTSWATSAPKRSSTSVRLYSVSSGTSWRSAAWIATGSTPRSARICAEAIGCVTYGSPGRAPLAVVGLDREVERLVDRVEVGVGVVLGDATRERRAERLEVAASPPAGPARHGAGARPRRRDGRAPLRRVARGAGFVRGLACVGIGRKDSSGSRARR